MDEKVHFIVRLCETCDIADAKLMDIDYEKIDRRYINLYLELVNLYLAEALGFR